MMYDTAEKREKKGLQKLPLTGECTLTYHAVILLNF